MATQRRWPTTQVAILGVFFTMACAANGWTQGKQGLATTGLQCPYTCNLRVFGLLTMR